MILDVSNRDSDSSQLVDISKRKSTRTGKRILYRVNIVFGSKAETFKQVLSVNSRSRGEHRTNRYKDSEKGGASI